MSRERRFLVTIVNHGYSTRSNGSSGVGVKQRMSMRKATNATASLL